MRTIRVKGTGKFTGKPDLIEITFSIITDAKTYDATMEKASISYNTLKNALTNIGFNSDDLKTTHFSISAVYDSVKNTYGDYKQVFKGYRHVHNLLLEMPMDISKLGLVLNVIHKANVEPNLNIGFTIKNKNMVKQELVIDAVRNAKLIALAISEASSVSLGEIVEIIYDWNDMHIYSRSKYDMNVKATTTNLEFDITPEEISLTDSVTVVWEIK